MGLISSAYDAYKINKEYSRKWEPKEQPKMATQCLVCGEAFINIKNHHHYDDHKRILNAGNKEQPKMTRDEAELIVRTTLASNNAGFVTVLEKLGLLKFDEPKINVLFNYGKDAADTYDMHTPIAKAAKQYGTIRLEEWPEGLVLWVGGEIRWRSWLDKRPDEVNPV